MLKPKLATVIMIGVLGPALALGIDALIGPAIDGALRPPPQPALIKATPKTIRTVPLVRWKLWCERIGGIECPR